MSLRTTEQNARFHKLLTEAKFDSDDKRALIEEVTNGRVSSSKEMNRIEMAKAIKILSNTTAQKKADTRKKQMAKAFNLARAVGMLTGEKEQTDFTKLNQFCKRQYGVEKFNLLDSTQISGIIIGLTKIKESKESVPF